MDSEENDVVSKVATLGAADLVPRGSVRRSLPNASRQSKKIRTSNIKRLSKSPKTLSGLSNPRNLKCFPTSRSSQSPRKSSADFTSTDSPTKASANSTNIDKTANSTCASQDPKESTPTEREADEVPPDSTPQDCLVVCVDIDCSQNTSTESGISEKETTLENEEEPAESGSESKNDETSSWHPSEDDATSVSGGSPRRPRRSAQSDGNSINLANRRKRTRKRLYCDSDSSMSSSPSCVTKENRKHKQRFVSTEVDTINGFTSDREKENNGPESDDFCWICHKVGKVVICSCCPRVYHSVCLCMNHFPETWICPECQDLLVSECTLYQLPAWKNITPSQLQDMLLFLIDRLSMQHWAEHFREPVDVGVVEGYSDVIAYPMDLSTLYRRVLGGAYASTQAFLGDFRWILHNCIIFNGASSPLTSCARLLDQACSRELALMRACPTCYLSRMPAVHVLPSTPKVLPLLTKQEWLRSVIPTTESPKIEKKVDEFKLSENSPIDPWWFCKLCDVVHPLVWVRLEYYPRWPAKVMAVDTHEILVTFFGDYDVTMAPLGSARVHSDSRTGRSPFPLGSSASGPGSEGQTSSDQSFQCVSPLAGASCAASKGARNGPRSSSHLTVDASYKQALVELDYHMTQIKERYPTFKLPLSPVEFTQRYYAQFQKSYGPRSVKNTGKVTSSDGLTNENITTITETDSPATAVVSRKSQSVPPLKLISNADNLEPVLARAATGLLSPSSSRNAMDPVTSKIDAKPLDVNTCEQQQHSDTAQSSSSTAVVVLKMDVSEHPGSVEPRSQSEPKDDLDRPPTVLQPIPIIGRADDTESMDEIHVLLERMRTQFQQSLQCLEEKWHLAHANDERKHSLSRDPPVLSAATVETEVQTDFEPTGKRSRKGHCEASSDVVPKVMDASTITKRVSSPLTPIQAVMMEGEIARLERENQRLNLLLAFTRAEMAFEMRHRIAELRRVWNFEVTAVLESASSIWEQDLIRIVDAVKRKQWCAYCGRVAFYYCCWNTCYCNSACQAKHWASHINSCVQARSQQALVEASTAAPTIGISTIPSPMASVSFDKVERSHHQSHQTMVAWPAAPVHSVTSVAAQTGGLACRTMSNTVRGKLNS